MPFALSQGDVLASLHSVTVLFNITCAFANVLHYDSTMGNDMINMVLFLYVDGECHQASEA